MDGDVDGVGFGWFSRGCCCHRCGPFQPLLRQLFQGVVGLAVEHRLKKIARFAGVSQAMQLDVAQQQSDEGSPSENGCLLL